MTKHYKPKHSDDPLSSDPQWLLETFNRVAAELVFDVAYPRVKLRDDLGARNAELC